MPGGNFIKKFSRRSAWGLGGKGVHRSPFGVRRSAFGGAVRTSVTLVVLVHGLILSSANRYRNAAAGGTPNAERRTVSLMCFLRDKVQSGKVYSYSPWEMR